MRVEMEAPTDPAIAEAYIASQHFADNGFSNGHFKASDCDAALVAALQPEHFAPNEIDHPQLTIVNVSNRHVGRVDDENNIVFSPGGLVTGVKSAVKRYSAKWKWFGWDGKYAKQSVMPQIILNNESQQGIEQEQQFTDPNDPFEKLTRGDDLEMFGVKLSEEQVIGHYEHVSNNLWWMFHHGKFDHMILPTDHDWQMHDEALDAFITRAEPNTEPSNVFINHDYQIYDLWEKFKEKRPGQKAAYFHHIAFQPAEALREYLPEELRAKLLHGLLAHDLVGFQTAEYRDNFINSVLEFVPEARIVDIGEHVILEVDGRKITVGAFPISIDPREVRRQVQTPEVIEKIEQNKEKSGKRIKIANMRRNDLIKDIVEDLEGYEYLLDTNPWLADYIEYVCVIAESREALSAHRENRQRFEEVIQRIQDKHGPQVLNYIDGKGLPYEDALALLASADIAYIVTGQEGMNLVAKEAAAVGKPDMVLILGKDAGAAQQMNGYAILVDPKNKEELANGLFEALITAKNTREEAKDTLETMVDVYDSEWWITDLVQTLLAA